MYILLDICVNFTCWINIWLKWCISLVYFVSIWSDSQCQKDLFSIKWCTFQKSVLIYSGRKYCACRQLNILSTSGFLDHFRLTNDTWEPVFYKLFTLDPPVLQFTMHLLPIKSIGSCCCSTSRWLSNSHLCMHFSSSCLQRKLMARHKSFPQCFIWHCSLQ